MALYVFTRHTQVICVVYFIQHWVAVCLHVVVLHHAVCVYSNLWVFCYLYNVYSRSVVLIII